MGKVPLLLIVLLPITGAAQNVGIGTPSPSGKLQINHNTNSAMGLRLVDSSGNRAGSVEFRHVNNTKRMVVSGYTSRTSITDSTLTLFLTAHLWLHSGAMEW